MLIVTNCYTSLVKNLARRPGEAARHLRCVSPYAGCLNLSGYV